MRVKTIAVVALLSAACGGTFRGADGREPSRQALAGQEPPEPHSPATGIVGPVEANDWFQASGSGRQCPNLGQVASTTRFVCDCQSGASPGCVRGDDTALGTENAPLRTYSKAREMFRNFGAGQSVAFCRGGSFHIEGERDWTNARCTSERPCGVRDYTPPSGGNWPAPILRASEGHGFTLVNGGAAEHEEGFVFMNLDLRSTSGGKDGNGFFFYNDVDDVLACGVSIDGFAIGLHTAGANPPGPGSDGKNARIVLRNSRVTNNGDQGWLGGCDGCGVEYTSFENNGFNQAILNHSIYFGSVGATGMFALHNELYRSAIVDGKCQGAPLVVHGQIQSLRIEGNTVREEIGRAEPTCWGIVVDAGYEDRKEGFQDVTIRGNDIINVGNVGVGVNACQRCVIEENLLIHEQPFGSTLISAPNRRRSADDLEMGSVLVRNNTLFVRSAADSVGVQLGGEGEGHVASKNALLSLGTGGFACFAYDLAPASYGERNHNVCYATSGASWTDRIRELSAWQKTSRADRASTDDDPRKTPGSARFRWRLRDGSSLIDSRH